MVYCCVFFIKPQEKKQTRAQRPEKGLSFDFLRFVFLAGKDVFRGTVAKAIRTRQTVAQARRKLRILPAPVPRPGVMPAATVWNKPV